MHIATHGSRKSFANFGRMLAVMVFCTAVPALSTAQNSSQNTAQNIVQNVDPLYAEKCAGCHAADGSGHTTAASRLAVPDLRSKRVKQMSDDDLYAATAQGKGHKAYPHAFLHTGLTELQIRHLISYLRTFGTDQN